MTWAFRQDCTGSLKTFWLAWVCIPCICFQSQIPINEQQRNQKETVWLASLNLACRETRQNRTVWGNKHENTVLYVFYCFCQKTSIGPDPHKICLFLLKFSPRSLKGWWDLVNFRVNEAKFWHDLRFVSLQKDHTQPPLRNQEVSSQAITTNPYAHVQLMFSLYDIVPLYHAISIHTWELRSYCLNSISSAVHMRVCNDGILKITFEDGS